MKTLNYKATASKQNQTAIFKKMIRKHIKLVKPLLLWDSPGIFKHCFILSFLALETGTKTWLLPEQTRGTYVLVRDHFSPRNFKEEIKQMGFGGFFTIKLGNIK